MLTLALVAVLAFFQRGYYLWTIPDGHHPTIQLQWVGGNCRANLLNENYVCAHGLVCNPEEFIVRTNNGGDYASDRSNVTLIGPPCTLTLTARGVMPTWDAGVNAVGISLVVDGRTYEAPIRMDNRTGEWTATVTAEKTSRATQVTMVGSLYVFVLGSYEEMYGAINEMRLATDLVEVQ